MESIAYLTIILLILAIVGIIIYCVSRYYDYKPQFDNQILKTSNQINSEKQDRIQNLTTIVNEINPINENIHDYLQYYTNEQKYFMSNMNLIENNFTNNINSTFSFADASGNPINIDQIPYNDNTPNNQLLYNLKVGKTLSTSGNLKTTGNVQICNNESSSKCIKFSNNNTYLTNIGQNDGSIILDGTHGTTIKNNLNVSGQLNINNGSNNSANFIPTSNESLIINTNRLALGHYNSYNPTGKLTIESPANTNDDILLLSKRNNPSSTHPTNILKVSNKGKIDLYKNGLSKGSITPINDPTDGPGLKISFPNHNGTLNIEQNLIVTGLVIGNRVNPTQNIPPQVVQAPAPAPTLPPVSTTTTTPKPPIYFQFTIRFPSFTIYTMTGSIINSIINNYTNLLNNLNINGSIQYGSLTSGSAILQLYGLFPDGNIDNASYFIQTIINTQTIIQTIDQLASITHISNIINGVPPQSVYTPPPTIATIAPAPAPIQVVSLTPSPAPAFFNAQTPVPTQVMKAFAPAPVTTQVMKAFAQAPAPTQVTRSIAPAPAPSSSGPFFSTWTFTTMSATGANGPKSISYVNPPWLPNNFKLDNGIQIWTVPVTGNYQIIAGGASSAVSNATTGNGVVVSNTFYLVSGSQIKILVGQKGITTPGNIGGGGGTFIAYNNNSPILVAGGGGGNAGNYNLNTNPATRNALLTTSGAAGGITNGGGTGGSAGKGSPANGGAGFTADAVYNSTVGARSFINGGTGWNVGGGGFGGGGCGGGGYSGGGGFDNSGGGRGDCGGGGSYDSANNKGNYAATLYTGQTVSTATNGYNSGDGFVIIKRIITPSTESFTNAPITPIINEFSIKYGGNPGQPEFYLSTNNVNNVIISAYNAESSDPVQIISFNIDMYNNVTGNGVYGYPYNTEKSKGCAFKLPKIPSGLYNYILRVSSNDSNPPKYVEASLYNIQVL